jgi:WhiB family transcriptional regulator, redox-sensing transcriptional regulator
MAMSARAAISSLWEQAACQAADPELFFPVSGAGAGLAELARAKAICAACAVRERCLDYALETRQPHGVWGGTTEEERRVIAARRRRVAARQGYGLTVGT